MLIVRRPLIAVIAALLVAWLLPHAAARLVSEEPAHHTVALADESAALHVANRP